MANASLCVGLVCIDIVAESERFPVEDTDHRIPNLSYRRGGNASNSCSVLSQLGMKTEFLGTLSNSIQLDFIQRDFAEHSVSIEHCPIFPDCEFPTSIVILNACNSTRTIMHHPTNLQELGVQHFTNLNLNNYSWIHFEGRSANVDNIKQMIKFVRENSKSIKISVEIEKTRTVLGELLPLGDVVFISKEFSQFSGFPTMKEAVKGFIGLSRPGCIVVCAWGSEGAAAGQNVDGTDVVKCQSASAPCRIIDTLGAGDTFNAAFIYSQINLWDWKKGLEFACHIAGCKIGLKGFLGLGQFKQTFLFEASDNDRYPDGAVRLRNPNIELMDQDILYHLALGSGSHDLQQMFGDVKFVCMGGTPKRMEQFANFIMDEIGYKLPAGTTLLDISQYSYRYSMYKVGPVLSISHGMGIPSVGILLHEVIKLMYHARVKDPVFFRLGTCGGIGLDGGQLVITDEAVDGMMRPFLELPVLGQLVQRPSKLDTELAKELQSLSTQDDPFETHVGRTMCTYDFYEGQGRLDGAFCDYTEKEKLEFLHKVHDNNILNMEMESLAFAALTHHAGIRAAVICVTLLNRLNGDQVASSKEVLNEWQNRPQAIVARYIKKHMGMTGPAPRPPPPGPKTVVNSKKLKFVREESQSYE